MLPGWAPACRFPCLRALHLTQLQLAAGREGAQQLQQLTALTQLSELVVGGPGCSNLRTPALTAVGALTGLKSLSLQGCSKVRVGPACPPLAARVLCRRRAATLGPPSSRVSD
jgi:hypothetical protein